jgi:heme-degrading monooxygenase HmoA
MALNSAGKQPVVLPSNRGKPLVGRIWSGRTRRDVADEYLAYLYEHGVLTIEVKPGNLGVQVFRKFTGDVAEFTVISYWRSYDDMAAMHNGRGGDIRRVAHLDKDPDYLLELPDYVEVTELHVNDWQPAHAEAST